MGEWAGEKSKHQKIIDAIITRFGNASIFDGYNLDTGPHVFEWKPEPWTIDDMPGIDIRDDETGERGIGQEIYTLTIHARCVMSGNESHEDVRRIKADVVTLVSVDPTWGGLAEDTGMIKAGLAQIEQGENTISGVDVTFDIEYVTEINNAYQ